MAIKAEELNVILTARDKEFQRKMKAAERRVTFFKNRSNKNLGSVTKAFGGLGRAAAAFLPALSVAALVAGVKRVTNQLDEIGKKADQIGLTTDALQELRSIAESAGVAQTKLDSSMERFSKRLGEAEMGMGAAKNALEELNLSASDLTAMPLDDALTVVAEKMSQIESPTRQAALAAGLFGREGVAMINMMRDGASGMDAMRQQARDLGIVIDEELIRGAEEAQTQLDLMSRVISANLSSALIELAPHLVSAATGIANLSRMAAEFLKTLQVDFALPELLDADGVRALAAEYEGLEGIIARIDQNRAAESANMDVGNLDDAAEFARRAAQAESELRDAVAERQRQQQAAVDYEAGARSLSDEILSLHEAAKLREMGAEAAERQRIANERQTYQQSLMNDLQSSNIDYTEEQVDGIQRLGDLWEAAAINASAILNPIQSAGAATRQAAVEAEDATLNYQDMFVAIGAGGEQLNTIMQGVERSMESAFMSMIDGTQTASEAFKGMSSEIIKELYRILVVKKITGFIASFAADPAMFGGMGGTSPVNGSVRPIARAAGGTVQAGQSYMTGESGRELFVPKTDGRILSPAQTSSMGGSSSVVVNQTINVSTGVQQTVRTEIKTLMPQIANAAKAAVADAKLRGGSYGKAFG